MLKLTWDLEVTGNSWILSSFQWIVELGLEGSPGGLWSDLLL